MAKDKEKLGRGRPTAYSDEVLDAATKYLTEYKTTYNHSIPSLVGLCKILNRGKSTLYDWSNPEHASYKKDFSDIVSAINEYQEFELVEGGLDGTHNPTIAKLLLHKHGHTDRVQSEVTMPEGITFNLGTRGN